jgi:hypothetical protein
LGRADAVVGNTKDELPLDGREVDHDLARPRVASHVRERLPPRNEHLVGERGRDLAP